MIVHEVPTFTGTIPEQMMQMQEYMRKLIEEINVNNKIKEEEK